MDASFIAKIKHETTTELERLKGEIDRLQQQYALLVGLLDQANAIEASTAQGDPESERTRSEAQDVEAVKLAATPSIGFPKERPLWVQARYILRKKQASMSAGEIVAALAREGVSFTQNANEVVRAAIWRRSKADPAGRPPIFTNAETGRYGLAEWESGAKKAS